MRFYREVDIDAYLSNFDVCHLIYNTRSFTIKNGKAKGADRVSVGENGRLYLFEYRLSSHEMDHAFKELLQDRERLAEKMTKVDRIPCPFTIDWETSDQGVFIFDSENIKNLEEEKLLKFAELASKSNIEVIAFTVGPDGQPKFVNVLSVKPEAETE